MKTRLTSQLILLIIAVLISACNSAGSALKGEAKSALTQEEAASMIDSALQAINSGDYAAWSRDWDNDMTAAINEAAFQEYRSEVLSQYGKYVGLESVQMQPGQQKGVVRWVAIAGFEQGKIKIAFGFPNDGRLIKGIHPEAVE